MLKEEVYSLILDSRRKGVTIKDISRYSDCSEPDIKECVDHLIREERVYEFTWDYLKIPKVLYFARGLKPSKIRYGNSAITHYHNYRRRPIVSKALKIKIFERDKYKCKKCGISNKIYFGLYGRNLDIDHIKGQINGKEANIEDNLQLLCNPCNIKKGTYNEI